MNRKAVFRWLSLLWFGALSLLVAAWLFPLSNRLTRAAILALFSWFGLG